MPLRTKRASKHRATSAPTLSRSKSSSKSWGRKTASRVSKQELKKAGSDSRNVGNVYNYNGVRLQLVKQDVMHYEQFSGPTLISKAVWKMAGDLKIQIF
jgi:hypothetical protein